MADPVYILNRTAYLLCKLLQYFDGYLTDSPLQIGFPDLPVAKIVMASEIQIINNALYFTDASGQTIAQLTENGSLALGTSIAPTERLTIDGNILFTGSMEHFISTLNENLILQPTFPTDPSPAVRFTIKPSDGSILAEASTFQITAPPTSSSTSVLELTVVSNDVATIQLDGQNNITLLRNGNVGILESNPQYTLDVTGDARIQDTFVVGNQYDLFVDTTQNLIGIGTDAPIATLHLHRDTAVNVFSYYENPLGNVTIGVNDHGFGIINYNGPENFVISYNGIPAITILPNLTVELTGNLNIYETTEIIGNTVVNNDFFVEGILEAQQNVYVGNAIFVGADMMITVLPNGSGAISYIGSESMVLQTQGRPYLEVTPDLTTALTGNVTVAGNLYAHDIASFDKNMNVDGDVNVQGNVIIASNIVLQTYSTGEGDIDYLGTESMIFSMQNRPAMSIDQNTDVTFYGNVSILNELQVDNTATFQKSVVIQDSLEVYGNVVIPNFMISTLPNGSGEINYTGTNQFLISTQSIPAIAIEQTGEPIFLTPVTFQNEVIMEQNAIVNANLVVQNRLEAQTDVVIASNLQLTSYGPGEGLINYTGSSKLVIAQNATPIMEISSVTQNTTFTGNVSVLMDQLVEGNERVRGNVSIDGSLSIGGNMTIQDQLEVHLLPTGESELNQAGPGDMIFSYQDTPIFRYNAQQVTIHGDLIVESNLIMTNVTVTQMTVTDTLTVGSDLSIYTNAVSGNMVMDYTGYGNFTIGRQQPNPSMIIDQYGDVLLTGNVTVGNLSISSLDAPSWYAIEIDATGNGTVSGNTLIPVGIEDVMFIAGSGIHIETNSVSVPKSLEIRSTLSGDDLSGASQWITTGDDIYYVLGSVGIGTQTPQAKLDVQGDVSVTDTVYVYGNIVLPVRDTTGNGLLAIRSITFDADSGITVADGGDGSALVTMAPHWYSLIPSAEGTGQSSGPTLTPLGQDNLTFVAGNGIEIVTDDYRDPYPKLKIVNAQPTPWENVDGIPDQGIYYMNGNVGIGTDQPTDALHVIGDTYIAGNVHVTDTLHASTIQITSPIITINGDMTVTGNVNIQQNASFLQDVHVTGNASIDSDLLVSGNVSTMDVYVDGTLYVQNVTSVGGQIDVLTNMSIMGNVIFEQDATVQGNLTVEGNTTIFQNFVVTDTAYFQTLQVQNDFTMDSNLNVGNGVLYVDKDNQYVGINTTSPTDALYIDGDVYITGNLMVLGPVNVPLTVDGDLVVKNNLQVYQNFTVGPDGDEVLYVDTQYNLVGINTSSPGYTLTVYGNAYISGNLRVEGDDGLNLSSLTLNNLYVEKNAIVSGNFFVLGNETVINTDQLTIRDNLIIINNGELGPGVSAGVSGFYVDRGHVDGNVQKPYLGNFNFYYVEQIGGGTFQIGFEDDTQPIATREEAPYPYGLMYWNEATSQFITNNAFYINDDTLVINNGGKLGVGTTTPTHRLEINGDASIGTTLDVGGDFSVNTNKFTVNATTGATNVSGALTVGASKFTVNPTTGNTAVAGTLSSTGDFSVNTSQFTVNATTGNTTIAGTATIAGDVAVNTSQFTVNATTGDTSVAGNLTVDTSTLFVNASTNRVGIGSLTPAYTLDVNGSTAIGTRLWGQNSLADPLKLGLQGTDGTEDNKVFCVVNPTDNTQGIVSSIQLFTSGSQRMLINSSGQVGFGSGTPATRLDISYAGTSSNADTVNLYNSSTGAVGIQYRNSNFSTNYWQTLARTSGARSQFVIGRQGISDILSIWSDSSIQMNNTITSRKLVLYDNASPSNNYQFMGIGISNPSNFLLQTRVKATTDDIVYITGVTSSTESELMRIKGTGQVGIGTNAPTFAGTLGKHVHIHSIANDYTSLHLTNSVTGAGQYNGASVGINPDTPAAYIWNYSNAGIYFGANNVERMRITAGGNVGIGTTQTTNPLTNGVTLQLHDTNATPGYRNTAIHLTSTTTGATATDGFAVGLDASNSNSVYFTNYENAYMSFATNATERMRITPTGLVGIGSTDPAQALAVIGTTVNSNPAFGFYAHGANYNNPTALIRFDTDLTTLTTTGNTSADQAALVLFNGSTTNNTYNRFGFATFDQQPNGVYQGMIACQTKSNTAGALAADMLFATAGAAGIVEERMRIMANGNIGIGTTTSSSSKMTIYDSGTDYRFIQKIAPAPADGGAYRKDLYTQTGDNVSGESDMRLTWTYHERTSSTVWKEIQTWKAYGGYAWNNGSYPERNGFTHYYNNGTLYIGIGQTSPGYQLELSQDSAAKPSTSTWTTTSDRRLKEDIETADYSLCYERVRQIPLRYFKWKDVPGFDSSVIKDRHKLGWIAQEVEQYFPKAVNKRKENPYDIEDLRDLNVDQLYATMYGALHSLIEKNEVEASAVESLEKQADTLESMLLRLEAKLQQAIETKA